MSKYSKEERLEIGLASSFYDFLSTAHKSKLVKTKEETLKIMERI